MGGPGRERAPFLRESERRPPSACVPAPARPPHHLAGADNKFSQVAQVTTARGHVAPARGGGPGRDAPGAREHARRGRRRRRRRGPGPGRRGARRGGARRAGRGGYRRRRRSGRASRRGGGGRGGEGVLPAVPVRPQGPLRRRVTGGEPAGRQGRRARRGGGRRGPGDAVAGRDAERGEPEQVHRGARERAVGAPEGPRPAPGAGLLRPHRRAARAGGERGQVDRGPRPARAARLRADGQGLPGPGERGGRREPARHERGGPDPPDALPLAGPRGGVPVHAVLHGVDVLHDGGECISHPRRTRARSGGGRRRGTGD